MSELMTENQRAWLEARGLNETTWHVLTNSIFVGAQPQSIMMAVEYCKARGLDIMKKPCHIVPMWVKDAKTNKGGMRDIIMPSITEQRITAARTGEYAGQDAAVFGEMVTIRFGNVDHVVPDFCTITVYRIVQGQKVPFTHTEYFEEACATTKDGGLNTMWTKRKRGQLAKCAEAGALRKAFPEEIGNEYTVEEMQGKTININGVEEIEVSEPQKIEMDITNDDDLYKTVKASIENGSLDKKHVLSGDAGYIISENQREELLAS